jgi:antitoxin (DNA-binding transcriptional repressor) of toxin-antitoxin stability system
MKVVSISAAKSQLSKLVDEAFNGKPFVIAKAGKPMVTVTALPTPVGKAIKRLGFMAGHIFAPDDFDRMGGKEIEHLLKERGMKFLLVRGIGLSILSILSIIDK